MHLDDMTCAEHHINSSFSRSIPHSNFTKLYREASKKVLTIGK